MKDTVLLLFIIAVGFYAHDLGATKFQFNFDAGTDDHDKDTLDGDLGPWSACVGVSDCGEGIRFRKSRGNHLDDKYEFQTCTDKHVCRAGSAGLAGEEPYSEWTQWTPCTTPCGNGTRERSRFCFKGEDICTKGFIETEKEDCVGGSCGAEAGPINGNYTEWSEFYPCSTSCDMGIQARYRYCTNPLPSNGGEMCGKGFRDQDTRACTVTPCVDGEYGSWVELPCFNTTSRARIRLCNDPISYGGLDCSFGDVDVEAVMCDPPPP